MYPRPRTPTAPVVDTAIPRRPIRRGYLPAARLGRYIRVSPAVLDEFIRSGGKALDGREGGAR